MRTLTYQLRDLKKVTIEIGFEGENNRTQVRIDCGEVFAEYPNAEAALKVQAPKGGIYPATVTRDGNMILWTVRDCDVANNGNGEFQLTFTDGETVVKSCRGRIHIDKSLKGSGTAPSGVQDWLERAEEVLEGVEAAEIHQPMIGLDGYWYKWDQEAKEYVSTGTKAQGQDGVGIASIVKTGTVGLVDTYTITFTNGTTTTYTVTNGEGGTVIDDTTPASDKVFSSEKVNTELNTVKSALTSVQDELVTGQAQTYTGVICTLEGQTAGDAISITPDSSVNKVYHTKKNLFNLLNRTQGTTETGWGASNPRIFDENKYYNGFTYTGPFEGEGYGVLSYITDGIAVNKEASGGGGGKGTIFPMKLPAGKYTISGIVYGMITVMYYGTDNVYVSNEVVAQDTSSASAKTYTFTVPANTGWIAFHFANHKTRNYQYTNLMLVEGETAETYEACSFEKLASNITAITAYVGINKIWTDAGSFDIDTTVHRLTVIEEDIDGLQEKTVVLDNDVIHRNLDVLPAVKACVGYGMNSGGVQNAKQTWGMLITTDVHAREQVMQNAIDYFNKYPFLHVGMCLGDMAASDYAQTDGTWYTGRVNQATKPWYTVLGNHDGGNSADGSISATVADQFTKWIAPTLETMGMPSLTVPYYAVHNSTYGVSAIFLDCYDVPDTKSGDDFVVSRGTSAYSQAQIDWFINELNNVPDGNHLLIFQHGYTGASTKETNEWSQVYNVVNNISSYGELIPDIVNAWVTGGTLSDTYTTEVAGLSSLTVSADFTSRGTGVFAGYVVGHYHRDLIAHSTKYSYQKIIALCCTADGNWQGGENDTPRVENEKSQDCLTVLSVNKARKTVNLARVGANWTVSMKQRIGYAVDYDNS